MSFHSRWSDIVSTTSPVVLPTPMISTTVGWSIAISPSMRLLQIGWSHDIHLCLRNLCTSSEFSFALPDHCCPRFLYLRMSRRLIWSQGCRCRRLGLGQCYITRSISAHHINYSSGSTLCFHHYVLHCTGLDCCFCFLDCILKRLATSSVCGECLCFRSFRQAAEQFSPWHDRSSRIEHSPFLVPGSYCRYRSQSSDAPSASRACDSKTRQ